MQTFRESGGKEHFVADVIQVWNPDDWELFSYALLQVRHGALNVHRIPSAHKGDLGIDFYCTAESVAYQCYAVEEPVDIVTRSDRQKKKITTDLGKLLKNAKEVSKLFLGKPIKHWALIVPLHDSKEMNFHCSKKTSDFRTAGHPHLTPEFEVLIQDQTAFPAHAVAAAVGGLAKVTLSVSGPTEEEVGQWTAGSKDLLTNAQVKLSRRAKSEELNELVDASIRWFLEGTALLDALRLGAPDLHDSVLSAIAGRARRLKLAGPQGGPDPGSILATEMDSLVAAVRTAAPNLSNDNAEQIALGTVTEWIMRCPLDFPNNAA
jgi:hypothetical protein